MAEHCTLDELKALASELSPWAHLATVGSDGKPDVERYGIGEIRQWHAEP